VYAHAVELERAAGDPAPTTTAAEQMLAELRRLPGAEREVITLAVFGRLSASEIAAQLGLSSRTVKRWMRLGLQTLRDQAT
jgi:RNA polymerase sigma factor (sigma-70 family)